MGKGLFILFYAFLILCKDRRPARRLPSHLRHKKSGNLHILHFFFSQDMIYCSIRYFWEDETMNNRVTVTIAGNTYALLAAEDEVYMRTVADYVDKALRQTMEESKLAMVDCAVLTAMNIADERLKEKEAGENLRMQIKELLEEVAQLKRENSELKRQNYGMQVKLQRK